MTANSGSNRIRNRLWFQKIKLALTQTRPKRKIHHFTFTFIMLCRDFSGEILIVLLSRILKAFSAVNTQIYFVLILRTHASPKYNWLSDCVL